VPPDAGPVRRAVRQDGRGLGGGVVVTKTRDAPARAARPRARHDVGVEPLDWVRISLVLTLVAVSSGGALAVAGLARQGPLRDIGWTDRRLEGFEVQRAPSDAREIAVNAAGVPSSACTLEVTVEVRETRDAVILGPVHSREPRLPFTAPGCAGGVRQVEGRVVGIARLGAPLAGRPILDASDRAPVRQLDRLPVPPLPSPTPSPGPEPSGTPPTLTLIQVDAEGDTPES
jgi:hypothetical protein